MDPKDELIGDAEDLGEADEMDVVERLVPLAGLNVADIGCGNGRFTRQLAERGANALGVEPDPIQAEKNRAADKVPGLTFVEAPGQALPVDDASMDGVFIRFSLHHVAREHMDTALVEAMRVLKPESGFLYVLEPMLGGDLEDLHRAFFDESEERALAYATLKRVAEPRFAEARELRYREPVRYESFKAFVDQVAGTTWQDFPRETLETSEVKVMFDVGRTDDGYVFTQNTRVNFYRGLLDS